MESRKKIAAILRSCADRDKYDGPFYSKTSISARFLSLKAAEKCCKKLAAEGFKGKISESIGPMWLTLQLHNDFTSDGMLYRVRVSCAKKITIF